MVAATNSVGANTAIQSQWTNRPNSGLTTALTITEAPTNAPAHAKATGQLRGASAFSGFALSGLVPATALLLLLGFFIVTYAPFFQMLTYRGSGSNASNGEMLTWGFQVPAVAANMIMMLQALRDILIT